MSRTSVLGLLFAALFVTEAAAQYDVRYEPSNNEVVDRMLTMAHVTKDDTVYDLGCGDGRIVITAAKKFGAKGVGIDIDPERIRESRENATKAEVTGDVKFIEQNLFDADIGDATVMMLFLWPSVNLRLRPKLFRDLKPGTRIVSHEHYMGDWAPDQTSEVYADGMNHIVYAWVLPANVSGTWEWTAPENAGDKRYVLSLKQEFQVVAGTLACEGSDIPVSDITLEGNRLRFTVEEETGDQKVSRVFDGSADGNSIEGKVSSTTGTRSNTISWKAKRDPSTIVPLDESPPQ